MRGFKLDPVELALAVKDTADEHLKRARVYVHRDEETHVLVVSPEVPLDPVKRTELKDKILNDLGDLPEGVKLLLLTPEEFERLWSMEGVEVSVDEEGRVKPERRIRLALNLLRLAMRAAELAGDERKPEMKAVLASITAECTLRALALVQGLSAADREAAVRELPSLHRLMALAMGPGEVALKGEDVGYEEAKKALSAAVYLLHEVAREITRGN